MGLWIELSTIPLYLFAKYSIIADQTSDTATKARAAIRGVVNQEMLHLALTGNILSALDSPQELYEKSIIPQFPSELKYEDVTFHLECANKAALEVFLKFESPFTPSSILSPTDEDFEYLTERTVEDLTYRSIGMFYRDLEKGINTLSDDDFDNNADKQFRGVDFFDDKLVVVKDKDTALTALKTIVDQGEGNVGVEDSHYSVFLDLYLNRDGWECHNFKQDVKTTEYDTPSTQFLYHLSRTFDAAYCYLLQTIQRIWMPEEIRYNANGHPATPTTPLSITEKIALRQFLLRNIHAIMLNVLSPIVGVLVRQTFKQYVGAPCFNFYEPAAKKSLYQGLEEEVRRAMREATIEADITALEKIEIAISKVPFS
jgi:hypothetical protein